MTDQLEVLEPSGSSVMYGGERIEVLPLTIGQLPKIVRLARPVIDSLMAMDESAGEAEMVAMLMDMLDKHGEAMFGAVALAVDKPEEFIAKGKLDEFVDLAKAVYEVNRDFFAQKLAPLLAGRVASPAKPGRGAGKTASRS